MKINYYKIDFWFSLILRVITIWFVLFLTIFYFHFSTNQQRDSISIHELCNRQDSLLLLNIHLIQENEKLKLQLQNQK